MNPVDATIKLLDQMALFSEAYVKDKLIPFSSALRAEGVFNLCFRTLPHTEYKGVMVEVRRPPSPISKEYQFPLKTFASFYELDEQKFIKVLRALCEEMYEQGTKEFEYRQGVPTFEDSFSGTSLPVRGILSRIFEPKKEVI